MATPQEWAQIKNFVGSEFDSPDAPGSGAKEQFSTLRKLQAMRDDLGRSVKVRSGYRTAAHNAAVGGASDSAHLRGHAADLVIGSGVDRFAMVRAAVRAGFRRVGIGIGVVHVDDDPTLPDAVCWIYENGRPVG